MRLLFLCVFFVIPATAVLAQQGNIWYFGRNAGLDFNTSPPTAISNGALNTYEGCASFSDAFGRILFYTDGVTVYNKSHLIMQNGTGLKGDPSASQSGIIVPWPGNDSLYYIFTADAYQNSFNNGNTYSVVNIKANGGLGSVITKNVRLYAEKCTEKIAICKHANGIDWWVVTKEFGNNRFRVFKVDQNGFDPTPIITDIGTAHTGTNSVGAGCMRLSADGKKLALAIGSFAANTPGVISETNLFDFDNTSGIISNFVNIPGLKPYGVEFSPDSRLLYVSYEPYSTSPLVGKIDQFDVNSPNIVASRLRITPDNYPGKPCGMQIAPDGKIYIVRESSMVMDVINSPNLPGVACDYQVSYVKLTKQNGMMPPNIISSFLIPVQLDIRLDTLHFCNRNIRFNALSNYSSILSYKWHFDDGDSSNVSAPSKNFPLFKDTFDISLSITVKVPRPNSTDSIIETKTAVTKIIFDGIPRARFGAESFCGNRAIVLKDSSTISSGSIGALRWDFGNGTVVTGPLTTYTYPAFGTYNIRLVAKTLRGCPSDTAQVEVVVKDKPKADFKAVSLCNNTPGTFVNTSVISSPDTIVSSLWSFGDGITSGLYSPVKSFAPGTYPVRLAVLSDKGCMSDTIVKNILVEDFPVAKFGKTDGCAGLAAAFKDSSSVSYGTITKWKWSFGDGFTDSIRNPAYIYKNAGDYIVGLQAVTVNGCTSVVATRPVRIESIPEASFDNSIACFGKAISYTNGSSIVFGEIVKWTWSFGDNSGSVVKDAVHTYMNEGVFRTTLVATSRNGCNSAPFSKSYHISQVKVSAGADTTAMLGVPFHLQGSGGYTYQWSPGSLLDNNTLANPSTSLQTDQVFTLVAANSEGCKGTDQVIIKVYKGPRVYVPSAFTPNRDGKNDFLHPVAAGVRIEYFRIFNRWGQVLYSSNGSGLGWDGTTGSIPQPSGTYVWMVKGIDAKGDAIADKGTIVLIR